MARRGSSISLEEGPVPAERDKGIFDSKRPPLLLFRPHELQTPTTIREASPEDGCPLLPSEPSLPSSPTVTAPMDVFLGYEDSHEKMRVGGVAPMRAAAQVKQLSSKPAVSSLGTSSWQHASDDEDVGPSSSDEARLRNHGKAPRTPVLQPTVGRAMTDSSYIMVDMISDMIPYDPLGAEGGPTRTAGSNTSGLSPYEVLQQLGTSNGVDSGIQRQFRYDDSLLTHGDDSKTDSHADVAGGREKSGENKELESRRRL
ncbi:hypothetical protein N0V84_011955 [Fusarium piperis]|uniref:Uncharacterized protein n=1 Tax=Fusarium piperis TaxID=1435070 RepID=A0A9W8TA76_9HYPO|nr:hypothetical protein N0V84_011955 [Fusarium piperis]